MCYPVPFSKALTPQQMCYPVTSKARTPFSINVLPSPLLKSVNPPTNVLPSNLKSLNSLLNKYVTQSPQKRESPNKCVTLSPSQKHEPSPNKYVTLSPYIRSVGDSQGAVDNVKTMAKPLFYEPDKTCRMITSWLQKISA